ncbi:MAG: hypothetical protein P4L90_02810 [Rhodopila sp.]|nr:hypothetical protein [Rhodopila sp.]
MAVSSHREIALVDRLTGNDIFAASGWMRVGEASTSPGMGHML